jgi:hypothetical protein
MIVSAIDALRGSAAAPQRTADATRRRNVAHGVRLGDLNAEVFDTNPGARGGRKRANDGGIAGLPSTEVKIQAQRRPDHAEIVRGRKGCAHHPLIDPGDQPVLFCERDELRR